MLTTGQCSSLSFWTMNTFKALRDISPQRIWEGVLARVVEGDKMSFAVVELSPNSVVGEHQHANEQIGIVLQGSLTFTIGGEPRLLRTGDTYNIAGGIPHHAVTGPDGAVVVDVFAPVRADWARFAKGSPERPVWP
jgi:quercetin dioxygenase-like cupin family protein